MYTIAIDDLYQLAIIQYNRDSFIVLLSNIIYSGHTVLMCIY